jgi:hypothetical protein
MYSTLPYYASYVTAFTETSVAGFGGIILQKFKSDLESRWEKNHIDFIHKLGAMALGSIKKAFQIQAGVDMTQAAFLSLGYSPLGFLGHTFVILTVSPTIEISAFLANHCNAPKPVRMFLDFINEHIGGVSMVAALISALVIVNSIGFFHVLPLAIASSAAYLLYKTYTHIRAEAASVIQHAHA